MDNRRLAEQIIGHFEKGHYFRFDHAMKKNKDNEELFDILLENPIFIAEYLGMQPDEKVFKTWSISIQKKIIERVPDLIRMASEEIRNDREYMEGLQYRLDTNQIENPFKMSVYEYLGPKLTSDLEYMLSIQDKEPLSFLKIMKNNNFAFDKAIVKAFFDKYPCYVEDLPDYLKWDMEYVVSLIERIPAEHVLTYCSNMSYEYLKLEPIRDAFIRVAGEVNYSKLLLYSLDNDEDQLKKVSASEFRELILLDPEAFLWSDKFGALFARGEHKENLKLINELCKVAKLGTKNVNSPEKLAHVLVDLSSAIGSNISYDIILKQVTNHWDEIKDWVKQIDEDRTLDDGSLSTFEEGNVLFKIYNLLIGIECDKLDQLFQVLVNSEGRSSRFVAGIKKFNVTEDNLAFLQFACTCNLFNSDENTINMYNEIFNRISKWNNSPYLSMQFIERLSYIYPINKLLKEIDISTLDMDMLINLYGYVNAHISNIHMIQSLDELKDIDKCFATTLDKFDVENLEDKKHWILIKYFQIDMQEASRVVHSYLGAEEESSLYQNIPGTKYLKNILETIINSGSIEELEALDKNLESQNARVSFRDINALLNNIKKMYGNTLNESLLNVSTKDGVIDATDMDFNMLVHVIGAYGSTPTGSIYESWNTKEKTSAVSICTSYISDNNMGIAPTNSSSVILGFSNLPDNYLELMSCQDLYSNGFSASRSSKFMNTDELKNNTRHGHNEIVIRRRKGEFTEQKLEPSYIICFDEINENSRVAAQEFGVPIVFVDRKKVAERHHNEIVQMVAEFRQTLNPELISKIIFEQENNRAGLRLVRPDLVEEFFSQEFRQQNIDILYKYIELGLKNNVPTAEECLNAFVNSVEEEKNKYNVTQETPHRKNSYDISYEEMVETLKQHPAYKGDKKVEELTPEEVYRRFIECRRKLEDKEKLELQYVNGHTNTIEEEMKTVKVG